MIITIDGPSGAGKSTISRRLAQALDFAFLDTGALYRAVALAAQRDEAFREENLAAFLTGLDIDAQSQGRRFLVTLNGCEVEPFIRNEQIAGWASRLSALPLVRDYLLNLQRRAGSTGNLVAEGRDMGTVVFPQAEVKFFLTASQEERARRRLKDLRPLNPQLTLAQVLADMQIRDQRDQNRRVAPLKPAPGAILVDSTELNEDQVLSRLEQLYLQQIATDRPDLKKYL